MLVRGQHWSEADAPGEKAIGEIHRANWLDVVADPVRLRILRTLSQVVDATASDLAASCQTSNQTLRRHLEALIAFSVIDERPGKSDGETPGRPPARFSLPSDIRNNVRSVLEATHTEPTAIASAVS